MPDPPKEGISSKEKEDSEQPLLGEATAKAADDVVPSILTVVGIVWLFLATQVITSVASAMAQALFPLILKNIYGMKEAALGYTMSVLSAFNAIVNGFFLGPILTIFGGNIQNLIGNCVLIMFLISGLQAFAGLPSVSAGTFGEGMHVYIGFAFLLSIVQYVLSTTITSESTTRVGQNAKGTLIGLEHSLFAAARV